ncbi:MAG TPA: hypothetical protein VHC40_03455 [Rhizomicrobium sp.]|jgi:hypothetical protein|nr:hypothetical protein [Rhizomicrobium sp.]
MSLKLVMFSAALAFAPALAQADEIAPAALNSFTSVPAKLSSAQVLDQNGHVLGTVERVQTDQDGKPNALSFRAASDGRLVVIGAAAVSYNGHVLITSNDQPQIAALTTTRTAAK